MLGQLSHASKATKKQDKNIKKPLNIISWLMLAVAIFFIYSASAVLLFPQVHQTNCQANSMLVMGAAQYNGTPSPAFQRRLDKANDLYKAGCASQIITTGGKMQGDRFSEGQAGKTYLINQGVPEHVIQSETQSTTSYENILYSKELINEDKLTIVTDDLHAYRTWYLAKQLGYQAELEAVFSPARRWNYGFKEILKVSAFHIGFLR